MQVQASRLSGGWPLVETPDVQISKQGIPMKKIVIAAAALMISASAHAGTYNVEGVTVHVQDGCRSSSCVSVYAPDYGYYHGEGSVRVHKAHKDTARVASKAHKDTARVASAAKKDETVAAPAPAAAAEATPAKAPEAAAQAAPSDAAPAK
jgi:hypothetical protein